MQVTRTKTFADQQILNASDLNAEFNNLLNAPNIANADIAAGANIAGSKLATQLVGNYTISSPQTYTPAGGATATLDLSLSNDHRITMPAGNITIALSNVTAGTKFIISITQDGVGSRTVSWFANIAWSGGSAPTLTTTASKTDCFGFIALTASTFQGFVVGQSI